MLTLLHAARSTSAAAGSRGGRRRGMRAVAGFVPAGALLGPAGACGGGRSRAGGPVRSRSFARSDCAPPGTTCENSRDSARDGRRAVVERARGHARVPSARSPRATYPRLEVIVVDNDSSDGSPDAVAREHPGVVLVRLDTNRGFAGGMNAGIAEALLAFAEGTSCSSTTTQSSSRGSSSRWSTRSRLGEGRKCGRAAQIVFLDDPGVIWYAGAAFRQGRGHHGPNRGYGRAPTARRDDPSVPHRPRVRWRDARLRKGACRDRKLGRVATRVRRGHRLVASLPRAPGRRILVVPASVVRHAVSAFVRRSVVAGHALLRPSQRARGSRALGPDRPDANVAPPRRGHRGPSRAGARGRIGEGPAHEPSARAGATSARGGSDLDHGRRISRCAGGSSPTGSVSASGSGSSLGAGISARRSSAWSCRWTRAATSSCRGQSGPLAREPGKA